MISNLIQPSNSQRYNIEAYNLQIRSDKTTMAQMYLYNKLNLFCGNNNNNNMYLHANRLVIDRGQHVRVQSSVDV